MVANISAFDQLTALKSQRITTLSKPGASGGSQFVRLPNVGMLQGIKLAITAVIAGTLSAPNPLGLSSIIDRIKLTLGAGNDVIDVSGAGYDYLIRDMIDLKDVAPDNDGRAAVTTGTFQLDKYFPVALNLREHTGLANMQDNEVVANLSVNFAADSVVATGITSLTCTVKVDTDILEIPRDQQGNPIMPDNQYVHAWLEDTIAIPSTADFPDEWKKGEADICQVAYLLPSGFTRVQWKIQQSETMVDWDVDGHRQEWNKLNGRAIALSGALTGDDKRIFVNRLATDGLGDLGSFRDFLNVSQLTQAGAIITPVASQTARRVTRWLVPVGA